MPYWLMEHCGVCRAVRPPKLQLIQQVPRGFSPRGAIWEIHKKLTTSVGMLAPSFACRFKEAGLGRATLRENR